MAVVLATANTEGQESDITAVDGSVTFHVSGTWAGDEELVMEFRKTAGTVTTFYAQHPVSKVQGNGPVNLTVYETDVRFVLSNITSGTTAIQVEI